MRLSRMAAASALAESCAITCCASSPSSAEIFPSPSTATAWAALLVEASSCSILTRSAADCCISFAAASSSVAVFSMFVSSSSTVATDIGRCLVSSDSAATPKMAGLLLLLELLHAERRWSLIETQSSSSIWLPFPVVTLNTSMILPSPVLIMASRTNRSRALNAPVTLTSRSAWFSPSMLIIVAPVSLSLSKSMIKAAFGLSTLLSAA
mmetsp:Transcript_9610/g.18036  ORF Transcript_9610/g.18036 Transcript_9610/m.18036 type:complete len:209 (-) Transcript_9610:451-1077(-)